MAVFGVIFKNFFLFHLPPVVWKEGSCLTEYNRRVTSQREVAEFISLFAP